jgi:hypothetical protein
MPKSLVLLTTAAFIATLSGSATIAAAKPKEPVQFCSIKGGRAPCDWVERCLLDGGIPERRPFTGKLVCKKATTAAPRAQ